MFSRFFLSLTAFTLAFASYASADDTIAQEEFIEEELDAADDELASDEEKAVQENPHVAFPQKVAEQKEEQKKQKPHYAGVRRPQPKVESEKKTSKVKNEWFSSKTHPNKSGKKVAKEEKEEIIQLTDRPFYSKSSVGTPVVSARQTGNTTESKAGPVYEGNEYPHGGFKAPDGHVYITGEWLFWRAREEGMEFAPTSTIHFDFQSGYRVGLGVHLPQDFWDIYISYTDFRPDQSASVQGFFTPLFLFGVGSATAANAHWDIKYQNVDIEIGRAYYLAKSLTFRPFIGLKGSWIHQHANINYQGGAVAAGQTYRTHFKNDFKGAGPLVGLDSNWLLGAGFSFFGDVAGALVCGHFDNSQQQNQLNDAQIVSLSSHFNLVSPTATLFTGLGWDYNFHRDRCHFGIDLGFEAQYWWNQNQTEQFTSSTQAIYVRQRGDLAFYGLTLGARLDF